MAAAEGPRILDRRTWAGESTESLAYIAEPLAAKLGDLGPGAEMTQMLAPALLAGAVMACLTFYITDQIHPRSNARLKALMERTDRVRLTARDTDVTFSIRGIGVVKCDGRRNLPDGEVFTAPVRDSVEGVVTYNAGSLYAGTAHDWIRLTFEKGKVVGVEASNDVAKIEQTGEGETGEEEGAARRPAFHSSHGHPLCFVRRWRLANTALAAGEADLGQFSAIR